MRSIVVTSKDRQKSVNNQTKIMKRKMKMKKKKKTLTYF